MKNKEGYIIGIDGGGTKTVGILADLRGNILKKIETASSNPNKIGLEKAIFHLKNLLLKISKNCQKEKIKIAYLGLAGGLERDKKKRERIEKVLRKKFPFLIKVDGDQKIAFRSGTKEKNGMVIIAGTGSISMGWKGEKEAISGGWDWLLGDHGSAFWVGKKALEEALKSFDGRKPTQKLQNLIFRKWKIKDGQDVYQKFYTLNFVEKVASISKLVDFAAKKNDKLAKKILEEAGRELSKMAMAVIKKLKFQKEKFPIVLIGGMFKSKIVLKRVKKEIKKFAPQAKFIRPKTNPAIGAIRIAIEQLK